MSDYLTGGPIDGIFAALLSARPEITIERLKVTHPADDDNLWYIGVPDTPHDVQIECLSGGRPPFTVEGDGDGQVLRDVDADRATAAILDWLPSPN